MNHRTNDETTANRDLVLRTMDALNRHDLPAAIDAVAEELVNHSAIPEAQGRSGLLGIWQKLLVAFPDLSWTCEDLLTDGDRIVLRTRERGTNAGPLRFSRLPMPATGKALDIEAIFIFRIAAGRIVEVWAQRDELGMLRQLGQLTPTVGGAAVAPAGAASASSASKATS